MTRYAIYLLFVFWRVSYGQINPSLSITPSLREDYRTWMDANFIWKNSLARWKQLIEQKCSILEIKEHWESLFECPDLSGVRCIDESARYQQTDMLHCPMILCQKGLYLDTDITVLHNVSRRYLDVYEEILSIYTTQLGHCTRECSTTDGNTSGNVTALEQEIKKLTSENERLNSQLNQSQDEMSAEIAKLTSEKERLNSELKKTQDELSAVRFRPVTSCEGVTLDHLPMESRNETGGVIPLALELKTVYCDVTTDHGDWIVFQRRMDGSVDFYRDWNDYVTGFGTPRGEFWQGLEMLHQLTKNEDQELRIDIIQNGTGIRYYAKYSTFVVGPSSDNYRLRVGGYSGNSTDALSSEDFPTTNHDGQQFTTKDRDNDGTGDRNCAISYVGGWWYNACLETNLNGKWGGTGAEGMVWHQQNTGGFIFLKHTEMKIRKKQ